MGIKNFNKVLFAIVFSIIAFVCYDNCFAEVQYYTCTYTGQISGKTIQLGRIDLKGRPHWKFIDPDGKEHNFVDSYSSTDGNVYPSEKCDDVFYSKNSGTVKAVDATSRYADAYVAQYCSVDDDLEQFCSGTCRVKKPQCGAVKSVEGDKCPKEIRPMILFLKKGVYNLLQIFIPILLIVMASIDLTKYLITPDEKNDPKRMKKCINRFVLAIAFFFITTFVGLIIGQFAKTSVGAKDDWKACWNTIK